MIFRFITTEVLQDGTITLTMEDKRSKRSNAGVRMSTMQLAGGYYGVRGFYGLNYKTTWYASYWKDNKAHAIGPFSSPKEAALVRERTIHELGAELIMLNFPED